MDANGVRVETIQNEESCNDTNYAWNNAFMHFDNVIHSYYSLLEVSTFKGWISIINDAVDSRVSLFFIVDIIDQHYQKLDKPTS